jgi:MinD superfamily P-loop ATPase
MILTVASGKGGTGKTTFAVNLAYTLAAQGQKVRLLDCDVEEPNDHLFVRPDFTDKAVVTVQKPVWDEKECNGCGACAEACNYNAIAVVNGRALVFNELCHACGACTFVCPNGALSEQRVAIGCVRSAPRHQPFFFAHGELDISEALAPSVVSKVKTHVDSKAINIIDASPGTACPVVKALEGADVAVLLTEPTRFGLHDLKLAAAMSLEMGIPTGIVINRSGSKDDIIERWATSVDIPVVGKIPFKREYAETYSSGGILVDWHEELKGLLLQVYEKLCGLVHAAPPPPPALDRLNQPTGSPQRDKRKVAETTHGNYRELAIISGKGGTGKTTIAASFAALSTEHVLADNDVDAADLHLLMEPSVQESHAFVGGVRASVDSAKCMGCGKCADICHFDAFRMDGPGNDVVAKTWAVDSLACEGCGLCSRVCPVGAIRTSEAVCGVWFGSDTAFGPMVHACLGIAEENSGRLVSKVRTRAGQLAAEKVARRILGDGPPGTGCPVIASISGVDLVLIVAEPTVSGVHDMERVLELAAHFRVPALVIINKADLNTEQTERIRSIARDRESRVVAEIPFDRVVNDALAAGKTVIQYGESGAAEAIRKAWEEVCVALHNTSKGARQA